MAKKVEIKWNRSALRSIRYGDTAPKVVSTLEAWAARIADACNSGADTDGYKTSSQAGRRRPQGRHRTTVITATAEAMEDNQETNRLLRELHSQRPL